MASLPAVVLEGAKGVEKTATAVRCARTIRSFDEPTQLTLAGADARRACDGEAPVLIDEWQRLPEIWDRVRRAVDDGAPAGSFVLTGSAAPTNLPVHSGAGRITTVRMRPMTFWSAGADPRRSASGVCARGIDRGSRGRRPWISKGDGPLLGGLFESLVTLSVRVDAQAAEARVAHMRTKGGEREIDLIVERADGRVVAIESKLGGNVTDGDVRHLRWLAGQIGPDLLDAVVVTTGPDAHRRPDGIGVIPAAALGP